MATGRVDLFFSVFQLGQHYLILAEEKDTELNNCLAVTWLIKAAKQGRKSAAMLLQRCWIQKKGWWNRIQCVHACMDTFVFLVNELFSLSVILHQESLRRMRLRCVSYQQRASLSLLCGKQPWWCTGNSTQTGRKRWLWPRCWKMSARSTLCRVGFTYLHCHWPRTPSTPYQVFFFWIVISLAWCMTHCPQCCSM